MPLPAPAALLTGGRCRPQRPLGSSSSLPPYQFPKGHAPPQVHTAQPPACHHRLTRCTCLPSGLVHGWALRWRPLASRLRCSRPLPMAGGHTWALSDTWEASSLPQEPSGFRRACLPHCPAAVPRRCVLWRRASQCHGGLAGRVVPHYDPRVRGGEFFECHRTVSRFGSRPHFHASALLCQRAVVLARFCAGRCPPPPPNNSKGRAPEPWAGLGGSVGRREKRLHSPP